MVSFHLAWTMATRSEEPSYFCGAGPLVADMSGGAMMAFARRRGYVRVWTWKLVLASVWVRRRLSMEGGRFSAGDASLRCQSWPKLWEQVRGSPALRLTPPH